MNLIRTRGCSIVCALGGISIVSVGDSTKALVWGVGVDFEDPEVAQVSMASLSLHFKVLNHLRCAAITLCAHPPGRTSGTNTFSTVADLVTEHPEKPCGLMEDKWYRLSVWRRGQETVDWVLDRHRDRLKRARARVASPRTLLLGRLLCFFPVVFSASRDCLVS